MLISTLLGLIFAGLNFRIFAKLSTRENCHTSAFAKFNPRKKKLKPLIREIKSPQIFIFNVYIDQENDLFLSIVRFISYKCFY